MGVLSKKKYYKCSARGQIFSCLPSIIYLLECGDRKIFAAIYINERENENTADSERP